MTDRLVADLVGVLGRRRVHSSEAHRALYRRDASNMEGTTSVVCSPETTAEVQACVQIANRHGVPFVARGSGTGLSGGAVPLDGGIVISLARMTQVLSVDEVVRRAWVQPGVLNLDLSNQVTHLGVHFAPDPSSQQTCSIGGNVANNSGGPHCLAEGVTNSHVIAVKVVLPDGTVTVLGGDDPEPVGYDLRGVFVGSEGMLGIATEVCVKLTQNYPAVRTMLLDYATVADGAATVSSIIADGMVPAAIEMMDQLCLRAVEAYIHAGLPVDSAAALLVEVVGLPNDLESQVADRRDRRAAPRHIGSGRPGRSRARLLWKGRKSAFGAIANIEPDYYLHDTVVPRSKLPEVLDRIYEIAGRHGLQVLNVFHAGDGNLHPLLVYDARVPGTKERVHAAGREIVEASVAAGGVLTGEHGIGLEKRDYMGLMFSDVDLARRTRCVARSTRRCGRIRARCCHARRRAPTSTRCRCRRAHGSERVRRGDRR
ncbi:MAG: FAD-linked oxidase C-terminal domain-containing protein [Ilumatobacteraceae bacterium]